MPGVSESTIVILFLFLEHLFGVRELFYFIGDGMTGSLYVV
jgi:hypothetical protein